MFDRNYQHIIKLVNFVENELSQGIASKLCKVQLATGLNTMEVVKLIVEQWVELWDEEDE